MIVGDKNKFAIETEMIKAYENAGSLAWGFFVIYLDNVCYGVREPDATWLACSYNTVKDRLKQRGQHVAPLLSNFSAKAIVWAHLNSCWNYTAKKKFFLGFDEDDFCKYINNKNIEWAPDGDEAFDDSSRVLQFDINGYVRLIGYKDLNSKKKMLDTIRDIKIPSDDYYSILSKWIQEFDIKWSNMPKSRTDELWVPLTNSISSD